MKRNSKLLYVFLVLLILVTSGCNKETSTTLTGDEKTAAEYVNSLGYEITSYRSETNRYILNKKMLTEMPYMQIWGVQQSEPDPYLAKEIVTYGFIVTHHPLEEMYDSLYKKRDYEINIEIMIVDGNVVGGTSSPKSKDEDILLLGGPSALDGNDLETLKGMSYPEWLEEWMKKYKE